MRNSSWLPLAALTLVSTALAPARPASADGLPPTVSADHAMTPAGSAAKPIRPQIVVDGFVFDDYNSASERRATAFEASNGDLVTTPAVNWITCRASSARPGGGAVEWLGTQCGIKAVDPAGNEVRHWTRRDGLPGDYIESIAMADQGRRIYCLVRTDNVRRLALCEFDASGRTQRWKTLATLDVSVHDPITNEVASWVSLDPRFGRSRLAIVDGGVLVAPSAASRRSRAMLYRWSERRQTLSAIDWDASLRAHTDIVGVNDLWSDGKKWAVLATTTGLLTVNLPPQNAAGTGKSAPSIWRRYLTSDSIDCLGPATEGGRLYFAEHDRRGVKPPGGGYGPVPAPWELWTFDVSAGTTTPLPPRTSAPPSKFNDAPAAESLVAAADGAIWATTINRPQSPNEQPDRRGEFSRFDPASGKWTEFELDGLTLEQASARRKSGNFDRNKETPADPAVIPDSAAPAVAFTLRLGQAAIRTDGFGMYDAIYDGQNPHFWIEKRFSYWNCPENPAERMERLSVGRHTDPADPTLHWESIGLDLSAVHLPPTTPATVGNEAPIAEETFALHGGVHDVVPQVAMLVPAPAGTEDIVVQTQFGIFQLSEDSTTGARSWKYLSGRLHDAAFFNDEWVQTGRVGADQRLVLTLQDDDASRLLRYDPARQSFVPTLTRLAGHTELLGSSVEGAWLRQGEAILFAAPGGQPQTLDTRLPTSLMAANPDRQPTVIGLTGNIVWFQAMLKRRADDPPEPFGDDGQTLAVIGYDRSTGHWTAPQRISRNVNGTVRVLAGDDGAAYFARDQQGSSVFRYDGATDSWRSVAEEMTHVHTARPITGQALTLLSADARELYALQNNHLLRYDRNDRVWQKLDLPAGLWNSPIVGGDARHSLAETTPNAIWLGAATGLWRFDRRDHTWREESLPISVEQAKPEAALPSGGSIRVLAVDMRYVWGFIRPEQGESMLIFRFDKAAHQFSVYDRSNGLPMATDGLRLQSDGETAWLTVESGTYWLNPKSDHFVQVLEAPGDGQDHPSPKSEKLAAHVAAIAGDAVDHDIVYLAVDGVSSHDDGGRMPLLYRFRKSTGGVEPIFLRTTEGASPADWNYVNVTGGMLSVGQDVWVGTTVGVLAVDRTTRAWRPAPLTPGAPTIQATDIRLGADGAIWISDDITTLRMARPAP